MPFVRLALIACVCLVPNVARADIGLPMLALVMPGMGLASVPVVLIEAWIYRRRLSIPFLNGFYGSLVANLASTLLGIPVTWCLLLVWEICGSSLAGLAGTTHTNLGPMKFIFELLFMFPWLSPSAVNHPWLIYAACLMMLPPFFWASYAVEYFYLSRIPFREHESNVVRIAVRDANGYTYASLAITLTVVFSGYAIVGSP